jgi:hypothetical protein
MSTSLYAPDFLAIFNRYRDTGGPLQTFASPADWRDQWIYFLMNAIREFALSVGKKDFFTFGEVNVGDVEQAIAQFIGRPPRRVPTWSASMRPWTTRSIAT